MVGKFIILLVSAILIQGCTTSRSRKSSQAKKLRAPKATVAKAGTKDEKAIEPKEVPLPLTATYIQAEGHTNSPLKGDNLALFEKTLQVKQYASGSKEEAIVVIGVIKSILYPADASNIVEEDLYSDQQDQGDNQAEKTTETIISLEIEAQNRNIDIPKALESNLLLQSFAIHKMALDAALKSNNTPEYNERIKDAFRKQSFAWATANAEFGLEQPLPSDTSPLVDTGFSESGTSAPALKMADVRNADNILMESQTMADRGEFHAAINNAERIDGNSPLFNAAQEKIKVFSNTAVRELRQKAAQAFQSAIPVADPQVKLDYLTQAREYLTEALNNYPHADQFHTVRENLAVITKDLESIDVEE